MVMFPESSPFPEMPVDGPDRRFMAMPAYLGGKFDMAGMKWYGSNAENREKGLPRSILTLVLNDKDTGAPLAFMSANILSAYRTGAVPGVGFKYFADENAKPVGVVGPGGGDGGPPVHPGSQGEGQRRRLFAEIHRLCA